jgi:hypothetical protein
VLDGLCPHEPDAFDRLVVGSAGCPHSPSMTTRRCQCQPRVVMMRAHAWRLRGIDRARRRRQGEPAGICQRSREQAGR